MSERQADERQQSERKGRRSQEGSLGQRRRVGLLTTGEMAERSQNTLRTVRFYETEGLLRPVGRSRGGHRLFPAIELERLRLISNLRTAGFSLDQIRSILSARRSEGDGGEAARALRHCLTEQVRALRERVERLSLLADELEGVATALVACESCNEPGRLPEHCSICKTIQYRPESSEALDILWRNP